MTLVILPIYIVIRSWTAVGITLLICLGTSWWLKINWYDKLEQNEQTASQF